MSFSAENKSIHTGTAKTIEVPQWPQVGLNMAVPAVIVRKVSSLRCSCTNAFYAVIPYHFLTPLLNSNPTFPSSASFRNTSSMKGSTAISLT